MNIRTASQLLIGDKVFALNGRYEQEGRVVAIVPHHRAGFWITFQWVNSRGKSQVTRKRHHSVYVEQEPA